MDKYVVFGATQKLYPYLPMVINSLLKYNPDVKVVVLLENDDLDTIHHKQVTIINIKNYDLNIDFSHKNLTTQYTYMTNLRLYIPQLLPEASRALWIDVDTIIKGKLDELFIIDMTDKAVGMVKENKKDRIYCNAGICLFNLNYIREHELDKQFIEKLYGSKLLYPDQDVLNQVCKDHILFLDPKYNASKFTQMPSEIIIRHYIFNEKLWNHKDSPEWKEYYIERLTNE